MRRVELELISRGKPARNGGVQALDELLFHVDKRQTRTTHEPLESAGHQKVEVQLLDVDGNLAGALIVVYQQQRAVRVSHLRQLPDILDVAAQEEDARRGDETGLFVQELGKAVNGKCHVVRASGEDHLVLPPDEPLIRQGGKIQIRQDDFLALFQIQTAGYLAESDGDIGSYGNFMGLRAENRRHLGAEGGDLPHPEAVPCLGSMLVPEFLKAGEPGHRATRQRPQGTAVEIDLALQYGELIPVAKQVDLRLRRLHLGSRRGQPLLLLLRHRHLYPLI